MSPTSIKEQQVKTVSPHDDSLTELLMERICLPANLNQAYKRVKANKGSPGVDGVTVNELKDFIVEHKERLIQSLMNGRYKSQPVRQVEIPKAGGGMRQLGIPTVIDRVIQQAILQVLQPIYEPEFSNSSYGFRPHRSAHQAVKKARDYVQAGHGIVVDIDLEKFFDRVNHDVLMSRIARRIKDKRLLKIIRSFLEAGIMKDGVCIERYEGTPQGGPLSPLLSNILLDELDKELERRGHKFCRYADDCNIYVKSQLAGERVMASIKEFLSKRLRLKVNETKSGVARVSERQFLGFRLLKLGQIGISEKSQQRVKDTVRRITKRNRGVSLEQVITDLNKHLKGWINYFKLADTHSKFHSLDGWIRRKLRCYRLKQRKKKYPIATFLMGLGLSREEAWKTAGSGKGWWKLSSYLSTHRGMSTAWFKAQGLISLAQEATLVRV